MPANTTRSSTWPHISQVFLQQCKQLAMKLEAMSAIHASADNLRENSKHNEGHTHIYLETR